LLRRAWHGSVIFVLAILLSFACKLALVGLLVDANVFADFRAALATRLGTGPISALPARELAWVASFGIDVASIEHSWTLSVLYMLARLGYATFVIGYGSPVLGMAIIGMAFVTTVVLLIRQLRDSTNAVTRMRFTLLSASALVMPAWSLVFLSHTLLHAIWMVRPFAWFVALAGLLVLWATEDRTRVGGPSMLERNLR